MMMMMSELYGVRLLRRATANPAVAVALLNTPLLERRQYVKAAMQKLGLLLPKYDSSAPTTRLGSAKERLHSVLDDLAMRILLTTLMDPPAMRCSNMLVNLETMETETYPEGVLQHSCSIVECKLMLRWLLFCAQTWASERLWCSRMQGWLQ
jgi:hypothetical protein